MSTALSVLNAALDAALEWRVDLHRRRCEESLDVAEYLAGLREVREIEALLEPLRREMGATHSRAYELSTHVVTTMNGHGQPPAPLSGVEPEGEDS